MNTLAAAFRQQALNCRELGSPFMARLMTLLADMWPVPGDVAARCERFSGNVGPSGASVPLRLAGGLHALVLEGAAPGLVAAYPPNAPSDAALRAALADSLRRHSDVLVRWLEHPPQTNEIRRSAALIAGAHAALAHHPLPLVLSEVGASAGLNLNWHRHALVAGARRFGPTDAPCVLRPDWHGPVPGVQKVTVTECRGVDLAPLDLEQEADRLRAMAYLWPDQPERLSLTRRAAGLPQPALDRADGVDWLKARLAAPPPGHLHLVQNTVAWQYLPPEAQRRGAALMTAAGERATPDAPLGWLQMEANNAGPGAALTLQLWPGGVLRRLARVDFHGRGVRWTDPASARDAA